MRLYLLDGTLYIWYKDDYKKIIYWDDTNKIGQKNLDSTIILLLKHGEEIK